MSGILAKTLTLGLRDGALVGTPATTHRLLFGWHSLSLNFGLETIDVTTADDEEWTRLLSTKRSFTISGDGTYIQKPIPLDAAGTAITDKNLYPEGGVHSLIRSFIADQNASATQPFYEIVAGANAANFIQVVGSCIISSLTMDAGDVERWKYSFELMNSGTPTITVPETP